MSTLASCPSCGAALSFRPGTMVAVCTYCKALAALDAELAAHPRLSRPPVEGGWSVLLRRPALDPDEACALRLLESGSTLVHPGSFFDLPGDGHLVLSLLTPEADFHEGLERILPLI